MTFNRGEQMSARRVSLVLSMLLGLISMADRAAFAAEQPLKKGERILFLGDSITQAGAAPGGYVTLVKESLAKKHPDLAIEVIGAGISGNRVPDLEPRLDRAAIAKQPTLALIYILISDVSH